MFQNTLENAFQQESPAALHDLISSSLWLASWHSYRPTGCCCTHHGSSAFPLINARKVCHENNENIFFFIVHSSISILIYVTQKKKTLKIILTVKMFSLACVSHKSLHAEWCQVLIHFEELQGKMLEKLWRLTYKLEECLHGTQAGL